MRGVPPDLRLIFHPTLSDSYEMSKVLLASAGFDGTLQLLTSGWEAALGYRRRELEGKTLSQLMWSNGRSVRATIAAVLDSTEMVPVDLRVRCRDGRGKTFRLHRRFDRSERVMYLVAEEIPPGRGGAVAGGPERRAHERVA